MPWAHWWNDRLYKFLGGDFQRSRWHVGKFRNSLRRGRVVKPHSPIFNTYYCWFFNCGMELLEGAFVYWLGLLIGVVFGGGGMWSSVACEGAWEVGQLHWPGRFKPHHPRSIHGIWYCLVGHGPGRLEVACPPPLHNMVMCSLEGWRAWRGNGRQAILN